MRDGAADAAALKAALRATWPAAETVRTGGLETGRGLGGGGRVSATVVVAQGWTAADLDAAEAQHRAWAQRPMVQVWPGEERLAAAVAAKGWVRVNPTAVLVADAQALAAEGTAPLAAIEVAWPPLAVQREIWGAGSVPAARQGAMLRAPAPRASLLGRAGDRPAGAAFVAAQGDIAFLHALEVRPEARRQGVGAALLRRAAAWAARQGARRLALAVADANAGALALYGGLGFAEAARYDYWWTS